MTMAAIRPPTFKTSVSSDVEGAALPIGKHSSLEDVIASLNHGTCADKRKAAEFLRFQCRESAEWREAVIKAGGLRVIESLIRSDDVAVMESSVTALHNLSLSDNLHRLMVKSDTLSTLVYALVMGSGTAKANAAATVFNLCKLPGHRELVASHLGFYGPLVQLLQGGDLRGRKDAAHAMCYLSLVSQGRRELVNAGVVPVLVELSDRGDMAEKVTAVLNNLAKSADSRIALIEEKAVEALADVLQFSESSRAAEDATTALLRLASHNPETLNMVGDTGILPDLVKIFRSERTSEKCRSNAKVLVDLLRTRGLDENQKSLRIKSLETEAGFQVLTARGLDEAEKILRLTSIDSEEHFEAPARSLNYR